MWFLLALLAWPLVEIGLFVVIGGRIGLWATLSWVVLSAALGILVLRHEAERGTMRLRDGLGALRQRDQILAAGQGMFRMLAGLLLILPGFLTDALGLILLLPPVQAALAARMTQGVTVVDGTARPAAYEAEVIEAEWEEVPPPGNRPRGRSGWTDE